eukprot:snap_masked-scaffold990_size72856-processed-gene-0.7 protein:Tk06276 transcript:snap_masked-scaffold990_size72856-processed-gene-0.7-mRNA-1 annotation:"hypothetical protein BRAFLDRAFT_204870"
MGEYEILHKIGQGSFGLVHLARHKSSTDGNVVVVKEIKMNKLTPKEKRDVAMEVEILATLKHPNVIGYIKSFEHAPTSTFYIVMEHCEGGDLYAKINRQRGRFFAESTILGFFVQVCQALAYVHGRNILHRDIKSQNIFLTRGNRIKLGDFGISRILDGTHDYARTCIGTPYYLSPEIWENRPYNKKSDVWALGCVLYEMTTLKHAFEAGCMKNLIFKIIRGSYPSIPNRYSYDIRTLIANMLKKNPKDRPSVNAILKKAFVTRDEKVGSRKRKTKKVRSCQLEPAQTNHLRTHLRDQFGNQDRGIHAGMIERSSGIAMWVDLASPKKQARKGSSGTFPVPWAPQCKLDTIPEDHSHTYKLGTGPFLRTIRNLLCTNASTLHVVESVDEVVEISRSSPEEDLSDLILIEISDDSRPSSHSHGYLEEQRARLEALVGVPTLIQVYNLIWALQSSEDEQVDYADLKAILGPAKEHLIDDIIQLVVADNVFQ